MASACRAACVSEVVPRLLHTQVLHPCPSQDAVHVPCAGLPSGRSQPSRFLGQPSVCISPAPFPWTWTWKWKLSLPCCCLCLLQNTLDSSLCVSPQRRAQGAVGRLPLQGAFSPPHTHPSSSLVHRFRPDGFVQREGDLGGARERGAEFLRADGLLPCGAEDRVSGYWSSQTCRAPGTLSYGDTLSTEQALTRRSAWEGHPGMRRPTHWSGNPACFPADL